MNVLNPEDFDQPSPLPFFGCKSGLGFGDAQAVLFGAPHGTPYVGIDNNPYQTAPDALRSALAKYSGWEEHWDFDLDGPYLNDSGYLAADIGNLRTKSQDGPSNRVLIRATTAAIASHGAVPIMIGGDDSVPIPFFEGLSARGPITIIQIDAHIDWRDERHGERLGYSSNMRRASEMDHVEKIIQVGIRGIGSARKVDVDFARGWGAEIVTARKFHEAGMASVLSLVEANTNCVITLDCDGLDAAIMPAVMAPTPGGLSYNQTIDLVQRVAAKANLVGFDLIEFVPSRDPNGTAAITAARIVANAIGALARA